ncbi:hypothetical protein EDB19DRAFT_1899965 [Suillus lakei]|nr:hypothetical protein EDB19DRAFT_1899965 [Suillus lakei]
MATLVTSSLTKSPSKHISGDPDQLAITVVDKSGVHSLSICYCHCPGALSRDMQLFQVGLFPASFTRPKTAFTFTVLDDFLLDNLECNDQPKDGDLALFCPACPQPGINLDLSTSTVAQSDNTPSWLMTRYLVMDGNFKAEHMHPVNPSNEVSLMDGLGFMVSDDRYKSHLSIARDHVQRSDCNNH